MRSALSLSIALLVGTLSAEVPTASLYELQRSVQNMSYSISNQDAELAHLKQKIVNHTVWRPKWPPAAHPPRPTL